MNWTALATILLGLVAIACYVYGMYHANRAANLAAQRDRLHADIDNYLAAMGALIEQVEACEAENMQLRSLCRYRAELAVMSCLHLSPLIDKRIRVKDNAP